MEKDVTAAIGRLTWICKNLPAYLHGLGEEEFSYKPSPRKWSKKEILGHLVDSATNNHHRLVRAQFEERPLITYNADRWNAANYYQEADWKRLVALWENYNRHVCEVANFITEEGWKREVLTGPDVAVMTLEEVLVDYVIHLEHHLRQITKY